MKTDRQLLIGDLETYKEMYEEVCKERDRWISEYNAARAEVERLKERLDSIAKIKDELCNEYIKIFDCNEYYLGETVQNMLESLKRR